MSRPRPGTAQEGFETLIRGPVADALHSLGFKGTFRQFSITAKPYKGVIGFRKSVHSTSAEVIYFVELSILSTLIAEDGERELRERWRQNLWALPPEWWSTPRLDYVVQAHETLEDAQRRVLRDLRLYGGPALWVGLGEPDFDEDSQDAPEPFDAFGRRRPAEMLLSNVFSGMWLRNGPGGWGEVLDWDVESTDGLIELTEHENSSVRAYAVTWLIRRHGDDGRVDPRLIALASDPHSAVRAAAVSVLAHRRDEPGALEVLQRLSSTDPSYPVRWWARFGLRLQSNQLLEDSY